MHTALPSPPTSQSAERRWVRPRTLVAAVVAAVLVYASFGLFTDLRAVLGELRQVRLSTIGWGLALAATGFASRALRWHLLLRTLGVPASRRLSALTYFSGLGLGVTPGKVGEVVKTYYVCESTRTAYARPVAAHLVERLGDLQSAACLLAVGLASWAIPPAWPMAAAIVGSFLLVLVLRSREIVAAILRPLMRLRPFNRLGENLLAVHGQLRRLLSPSPAMVAATLGLLTWALETTAMLLMARDLGLGLSWSQCALAYAAGSVLGFVSFLPGGLGATEGGTVGVLLSQGVEFASATALTLGLRILTLWFGVALGALALGYLHTRSSRPLTMGHLARADFGHESDA